MLYRAIYYPPPDKYGHYPPPDTRILPTLRAVELWAQAKLKAHATTTTRDCYRRDVGRGASVTYQSVRRWRGINSPQAELRETNQAWGEILPEITIVPSVGELGYTP